MRSLGCFIAALALGCYGSATVDAGADAGSIEPDASHTRDADVVADDAGDVDAGAVDGGHVGLGDSCVTASCGLPTVCMGGPTCHDPWVCAEFPETGCTPDLFVYCGCDGVNFGDSSTCPRRAFAHRGPCEESTRTNCDPDDVACRNDPPECPAGTVPEVDRGCWTFECVPIEECDCEVSDDCPDPLMHVCYAAGHCGYPL